MKRYLAPALAVGFLVLFAVQMDVAAKVDRELLRAMGFALINILVGIAGYYFGSSQSSARKDAVIAQALNGQAKDG